MAAFDAAVTPFAHVRVARAVALARVSGGYFSGEIHDGRNPVQVDVDLDLGLLRVVAWTAAQLLFVETPLVTEAMPRGGVRHLARCMACDARALRVFLSEDQRHLMCHACALVRHASRSLSNERRAGYMAARMLALAGAPDVDILDDAASNWIRSCDHPRFLRHVAVFAARDRQRSDRARASAGRTAGRGASQTIGLGETYALLRHLIDERIEREVKSGRRDRGLGALIGRAVRVLEARTELRARRRPGYWRRAVEAASRDRPSSGGAASRKPFAAGRDAPQTPPTPTGGGAADATTRLRVGFEPTRW